MNLNIKEIRSYGLSSVFKLVNHFQIHLILAVLAVLLCGHIKNGFHIFVAQIFLNKERKQTRREEMLAFHFLRTC